MWYVMQVRTGTEENIRCQCQRLISSNVLERCFIPYYQQKKRFQGEWHIQERILFPGYVFLIAQNLECLVNGLKKVIGLTKLIGIGDQIVPLVQEEVELLMRIGTDKQLVEMSSGILLTGQTVKRKILMRDWQIPDQQKEHRLRSLLLLLVLPVSHIRTWQQKELKKLQKQRTVL